MVFAFLTLRNNNGMFNDWETTKENAVLSLVIQSVRYSHLLYENLANFYCIHAVPNMSLHHIKPYLTSTVLGGNKWKEFNYTVGLFQY